MIKKNWGNSMVSDYLENNYNIIIIESETYIQDTLNSIITLEKYNLTKYDILIIDSSVLQKKTFRNY